MANTAEDLGQRALAEIDKLGSLDPGWDSYDAESIPEEARTRARDCIRAVISQLGSSYADPVVGPTATPGVVLIWKAKGQGEVHAIFSRDDAKYVVVGSDQGIRDRLPIHAYPDFALQVLKYHLSLLRR
jgi:hypothetical protein